MAQQTFYCSVCDYNEIQSDDISTGNFYSVEGHVFDWKERLISKEDTCPTVIFAVCPCCKLEDAIRKMDKKDFRGR